MEPMTVLLIRLLPDATGYPKGAIDAAQVIEHLGDKLRNDP